MNISSLDVENDTHMKISLGTSPLMLPLKGIQEREK